jgi:hypothetical protein
MWIRSLKGALFNPISYGGLFLSKNLEQIGLKIAELELSDEFG